MPAAFFLFLLPPPFFWSSGWEVFFGRRERRKQKAAGEGEQLATANPPFHTQTGDNGGHWSICFYLSFFVLFFPHRAAGRCFAFPFARSLGPLSSYLFRHLPGQQFLLFMSETRREREAEGQRKRGRGFFFFGPFYPLFFPPPPLHSFFPAFLSIRITSSLSIPVQPTLSPSSTSPFFLLPPTPPLQSLSTRNFGYFLTPPVLFLKFFYFFALNSSSRVILIGLLVFSIYAFFTFVPFSYFPPFSFFLPPSYASFLADS